MNSKLRSLRTFIGYSAFFFFAVLPNLGFSNTKAKTGFSKALGFYSFTPSDSALIGYETIEKGKITGAIEQVDVKEMVKAPVVSFLEALEGRVAGVQISTENGQPGRAVNARIRHLNYSPLYIIDGIPVSDFSSFIVNPQDIESITVLKDAASTAIYGHQGANGVILVQTKRGITSRAVVSLNSSVGFQQKINRMNLEGPLPGRNLTLPVYNEIIEDWGNKATRTGALGMHNLSIRGGSERTRYFVSGSYIKQKGVVKSTGHNQYSTRISLDHDLSKKIKFGLSGSYNAASSSGELISNINNNTYYIDDIDPIVDLENILRYDKPSLLEGNAFLSYTILDNLLLKTTLGLRKNKFREERFYNIYTSKGKPNEYLTDGNQHGALITGESNLLLSETSIQYKKTFNSGHTLSALGLFSINRYRKSENHIYSRFVPSKYGIEGLEEGSIYNWGRGSSKREFSSYGGGLGYDYKSKYLLDFNIRADKSGNQWLYLSGIAIAWNIAEESFFKEILPIVSNSKLRFGYGSNSSLKQILPPGFYNPQYIDPKRETTNLGYDLGILNNRFSMSIDLYKTKANDIMQVPIPSSSQYTSTYIPIKKEYKGLELVLNSTNINTKQFTWESSFTINFNKQVFQLLRKTTGGYLGGGLTTEYIGIPIGLMYGIEYGVDGSISTNPLPTNIIDFKPWQLLHNGGFNNSLTYKNFDMHALFQWSYGKDGDGVTRFIQSLANRWGMGHPDVNDGNTKIIENRSYLRFQTLSLGYSIPQQYIQKLRLSNLRINVAAQNLITWKKYSDSRTPEDGYVYTSGYNYYAYPEARTVVVGINASF